MVHTEDHGCRTSHRAGVRPQNAQNLCRTQPGLEQPQGQDIRHENICHPATKVFPAKVCIAFALLLREVDINL